jgi:uncharacterized membrane protein
LPIDPLLRFTRDEDGAIAVIVALLLTVLMGFTALGVDVGALYRERAQLQSVSDLSALSAMARPAQATQRATDVIARNSRAPVRLETLKQGRFLRNPAIAPDARFTVQPAGAPGNNAVRVVLEKDAPLYFAQIFTDQTDVTLNRAAIASRTGAASFSLGSHIANLGGTSLNDALGLQFGASAQIGIGDMDALADARIDLGALLEALDNVTGSTARNPAEVLNTTPTAGQLLSALQRILPAGLASSLDGLTGAAGSSDFAVASLVGGIDSNLGLTATEFLGEIEISALDVVRALVAAEPSAGGARVDAQVAVPGLLNLDTRLTAGEPPAESGWIALGENGVQLHRAATRLKTDLTLAPDLLGSLGVGVAVTSVNLPLYVELAGATAELDHINCLDPAPQNLAARFRTAHTKLHPGNGTSVAALYLGQLVQNGNPNGPINPAQLGFADLISLRIVIDLPILPDIVIPGLVIQARSKVAVGRSQEETIIYSPDDVKSGNTTKTFGSGDLLSTAVQDLLAPETTEVRVKPQQAGLVSGLVAPVVASVLATVPNRLLSALAGPVDTVLDTTLAAVGLEVGTGELTLTGHHCELVRLVR